MIIAAIAGAVIVTVIVNAARWFRQPSRVTTAQADRIEAGLAR
jgi:hypothetical protein